LFTLDRAAFILLAGVAIHKTSGWTFGVGARLDFFSSGGRWANPYPLHGASHF